MELAVSPTGLRNYDAPVSRAGCADRPDDIVTRHTRSELAYAERGFIIWCAPSRPTPALATLLPTQLRYDGSLPVHPQLWQVGRSCDTLLVARHVQACTDVHLFGDEHTRWKFA
jgi:hypothetical protein